MSKLIQIADDKVHNIWQCDNQEECPETPSASVGPDYYQANGTPVCPTCDTDMVYIRTEVEKIT